MNMNQELHQEQVYSSNIGSFGRVKIAKNKKTGNFVALKIMKKSEIIKSKQTDHILNETKILAMIDHPFIVKLFNLDNF